MRNYKVRFTVIICLLVSSYIFGCDKDSDPRLRPADLLPASGEISGWEKGTDPGDYGEAEDQNSLYALINGAAELYIQHGFVEGVIQIYEGTIGGNSAMLQLFISDQGSSADAADLFSEDQVVPNNLPAWDLGDEAVYDENLILQVVIYVRDSRFFIRVTVDKENDPETALNTAQTFAEVVVSDIEE